MHIRLAFSFLLLSVLFFGAGTSAFGGSVRSGAQAGDNNECDDSRDCRLNYGCFGGRCCVGSGELAPLNNAGPNCDDCCSGVCDNNARCT